MRGGGCSVRGRVCEGKGVGVRERVHVCEGKSVYV